VARVVEAWMEGENGVRESAFAQGTQCTFRARVEFAREVENPDFAVAFVNAQRENVFVATTSHDRSGTGHYAPGDTATFSVSFHNARAPGRYALSTLLSHQGSGDAVIDRLENLATVVVTGARAAGGLVDLPHELTVDRGEPGA
jgi:hypothetical protein